MRSGFPLLYIETQIFVYINGFRGKAPIQTEVASILNRPELIGLTRSRKGKFDNSFVLVRNETQGIRGRFPTGVRNGEDNPPGAMNRQPLIVLNDLLDVFPENVRLASSLTFPTPLDANSLFT